MAKLFLYLSLVLLAIAGLVRADVTIQDIFTVTSGTTHGGCDNRAQALDLYLQEAIDSIEAANLAVQHYNDKTPNGMRIRISLFTWFGIPIGSSGTGLQKVIDVLAELGDFFSGYQIEGVPREETFLFCDSTWLTQKATSDTAVDWLGNNIVIDGSNAPISAVFRTALRTGPTPWFSGQYTIVNGYYFTSSSGGGNYCSNSGYYGLTSTLKGLMQRTPTSKPTNKKWRNTNVILCPFSFTVNRPASYADGRTSIAAGSSLENAIPRSVTLLHEALHVLNGAEFNEGDTGGKREYYGLDTCRELAAVNAPSARRNPENYVYFVSAMFYLFGDTLSGESDPSIKYWDFASSPIMAQGILQ